MMTNTFVKFEQNTSSNGEDDSNVKDNLNISQDADCDAGADSAARKPRCTVI